MWTARREDRGATSAPAPGSSWGTSIRRLFEGTERFFRSGYIGNLIRIMAAGARRRDDKLERGAKVADVGCGLGASTILMAKAFPKSTFYGFDYHAASIDAARTARAGRRASQIACSFEVAESTDFPGSGYDLIAHFDCLHDMEDPTGAARHARRDARAATARG